MATPNIVPRSDSEGGLGTASKYWASAYIDNVFVSKIGRDTDNLIDFSADNQMTFRIGNVNQLILNQARLAPSVNDASVLGSSSLGWSDLFLASGAVINFNDGNVTLTHSSGQMDFAGGNLVLADNSPLFIGSGGDGKLESSSDDFIISQTTTDKDLIFKCDDGSGGVETYFFLDGSGNVGNIPRTVFPDNSNLVFGTGNDMFIRHNSANSEIANFTGDLIFQQNADDKDIIFKCDDGSGGTTAYITLDGSDGTIRVDKKLVLPDNIKTTFGGGEDLKIYHDGTDSYIDNTTGDLYIRQLTDDKDIKFISDNGAGSVATYFFLDGSSATHDGSATTNLYTNWPDYSRISLGTSHDLTFIHDGSHSYVENYTNDLYFKQHANDRDIIFESDNGSGGTTPYFRLDGSIVRTSFHKHTLHNDNVEAGFGSNVDLRIQHNATNSLIDNYEGDLILTNHADDKDIIFKGDDGSGGTTNYFQLDGSSNIMIGYKSLYMLDDQRLYLGSAGDLELYHDATNSIIRNQNGNLTIENTHDDGDIIFRSDDGSGGVATYFFLDGSAHTTKFEKDLRIVDNVSLTIGNENDLILRHNGTNSEIINNTGNLEIRNQFDDGDIVFKSDDGSGGIETYFYLDGGNNNIIFEKDILFVDNEKALFGTSSDLSIYHDGNNSYLDQGGTGDLYIRQLNDDRDIIFECDDGSGGNTTYFRLDGSLGATIIPDNKSLGFGSIGDMYISHDGTNTKIENFTGHLSINNKSDDKDIIFASDDGSGSLITYFKLDGSLATHDGSATTNLHTVFPDLSNITLGDGQDFSMKHDGTDTIFNNQTGNYVIRNSADDKDILFQCDDGSGGITTYFFLDGSQSGSGNLYVKYPDNSRITLGDGSDLYFWHDSSDTYLQNSTGDLYIENGADDKDIILKSDDGSGGTTAYLTLDGSAEKVISAKQFQANAGIELTGNLNAPDNSIIRLGSGADLQIHHDSNDSRITNSTGHLFIQQNADNKDIIFRSDDSVGGTMEYFRVDGGDHSVQFSRHIKFTANSAQIFTRGVAARDVNGLDLADDSQTVGINIADGGKVMMPNLPTSDPGNSGQLWNDNGTLKISVG